MYCLVFEVSDAKYHSRQPDSPSLRWRVRFEKTAEFLAVCASGDTEEAKEILREARGQNGEDDMVNCANADGITALHQVRILLHF